MLSESHYLEFWAEDNPSPREYQSDIFEKAINSNLLVVIPTGMGKTLIGALLAGYYQYNLPTFRIIVMAPTRPLLDQHFHSFSKYLKISEQNGILLTGRNSAEERVRKYCDKNIQFFFMTPQTLRNDLINKIFNLTDTSLVIFDEAHRAMGKYAYCDVASFFHSQNASGRSLALTASPGSTRERITELCRNLNIPSENIIYHDKKSAEIQKYAFETEYVPIGVSMSEDMASIHSLLNEMLDGVIIDYIERLNTYNSNYSQNPRSYSQGYCLKLQTEFSGKIKVEPENNRTLRILLSINARIIKIHHLIKDLESQGLEIILKSLQQMENKIKKNTASIADKFLFQDPRLRRIFQFLQETLEEDPTNLLHPKMIKLKEILISQFNESPQSRILIFTKLRATVHVLKRYIGKIPKCLPEKFVGQASKSKTDQGMNQKAQINTLEAFRNGFYNILIATNVAEEGLDIAECNLVIFYDNVGSEIRMIQRAGRTGRTSEGKVIILYTIGTGDEVSKIIASKKQSRSRNIIKDLTGKTLKSSPSILHTTTSVSPSGSAKCSPSDLSNSDENPQTKAFTSTHPNISFSSPIIHIRSEILSKYALQQSFPVGISYDLLNDSHLDIEFTLSKHYGMKIINYSVFSFSAETFSIHQILLRLESELDKFIVFVDAIGMTETSPSYENLIHETKAFREITDITIIPFISVDLLHLKLRNILKYLFSL